MKKIPLTQGQEAIVDDQDYEFLSQWKWCAMWNRRTESFYAGRNRLKGESGPATIMMARVIMGVTDSQVQVDHKSHDTLDNRRDNLRPTRRQNPQNSRKRADNTSGYKGVTWCKRKRKWLAQIAVQGKNKHLGYHTTKEAAAHAYDVAAVEHHGEFALTNKELHHA